MSKMHAHEIMGGNPERIVPTSIRIACEQFDAFYGAIEGDLLPPEILNIKRPKSIPKRVPVAKPPIEQAWRDLFLKIQTHSFITQDFPNLWYLKSEAIKAGLLPENITQKWLERLRDTCRADRLSFVYGSVYDLQKLQGYDHLRPLRHRNQRHEGIPVRISEPLELLLKQIGLVASTERAMRLAVGILAETNAAKEAKTLQELLSLDLRAVRWSLPEKNIREHVAKISALRRFQNLRWTPAWRQLNRLVVEVGLTISKNPVSKILAWDPKADPRGLRLEWAQTVDRDLRSTLKNGPHGRADLAQTLARQLAMFDDLHHIPAVKASGLLPEIIGAIR